MKLLATLSLIFLFIGCQAQPTHTKDGVKIISEKLDKSAYKTKIQESEIQLVDVRTAQEFNAGHIEGAINIDYTSSDFTEKLQTLDKTKPVAIYCQSGGRSGKASRVMVEEGFVEIYDLIGGFSKW